MNTCERPNYYYYTSYIFGIIINLFVINALYNIERNIECKCAENSRKKYLKEWFIFVLILNIIFLIIFFISNYECFDEYMKDIMKSMNYINLIFIFILFVVQVIMLVRLYYYVSWLKNDCKCSYGYEEKIIHWYLIMLFIIFFTTFLLMILLLMILGTLN